MRLADELRAVLGAREHNPFRSEPSAVTTEDEAAARLYGERTGTVDASPAYPPLTPLPPLDGEGDGAASTSVESLI